MVLRSLREFVDHCMERLLHSNWPSAGEDFQSTLELEEIQHILRCLNGVKLIGRGHGLGRSLERTYNERLNLKKCHKNLHSLAVMNDVNQPTQKRWSNEIKMI